MRILTHHKSKDLFWFRIFGVGLNFSKQEMSFGERNGFRKHWKIFGWRVTWLKKEPINLLEPFKMSDDLLRKYSLLPSDAFDNTIKSMKNSTGFGLFNGSTFNWQDPMDATKE